MYPIKAHNILTLLSDFLNFLIFFIANLSLESVLELRDEKNASTWVSIYSVRPCYRILVL